MDAPHRAHADVCIVRHPQTTPGPPGTLEISRCYTIFKSSSDIVRLAHPLVAAVTLMPASASAATSIVLRTHVFESFTLQFTTYAAALDVYDRLRAATTPHSLQALPAFERTEGRAAAGWTVYDARAELERMGVGGTSSRTAAWRWSVVNADFEFCPTYPADLAVPAKISDVTLRYGATYRSKARIPALVYLHRHNLGSITRSSQPLVGLRNARSIQDEKLVEAIFQSHSQHSTRVGGPAVGGTVYGARSTNLIIDARPTTNAMANVAKGAGSESMERYRDCQKAYLGVGNIHVMRDSLRAMTDALREAESTGVVDRRQLRRSGWLRHISALLEGAVLIARNIHLANSHVLIHCSDGWDRTSQLSALAQMCLDPYYRTIVGFAVLVEKEFLAFGHKFGDRTGHTCADRTQFAIAPGDDETPQAALLATVQRGLAFRSSEYKETSPVFHQFLDCVYQMVRQFPARFEFDERLLRQLHRALYACEHGSFLYNSARERHEAQASARTASVWTDLVDPAGRAAVANPAFDASLDEARPIGDLGVILPDARRVAFWPELLRRSEAELNAGLDPDEEGLVGAQAADAPLPMAAPGRSATPEPALVDLAARTMGMAIAPRQASAPSSPSTATSPATPDLQQAAQQAARTVSRFGTSLFSAARQYAREFQTEPAR